MVGPASAGLLATIAAALLPYGEPATALMAVAAEHKAEIIVVGARHERSVAERLLGTVASEVTKRAPSRRARGATDRRAGAV